MRVYRLTGILPSRAVVTRYMRADSPQAVKVRAYKAFQMRCAAIALVGSMVPDHLGAAGYDHACNASYTKADGPLLRAMQSRKGTDNTGRTMYRPSAAAAVKINNRAQALLKALGLGA